MPPPQLSPAGAERQPTPPESPEDVITRIATKEGVNPKLALSIAQLESSFRWNPPDAGKGAVGIMQVMPATAAKYNLNPRDPYQNVLAGIRELKALRDEHKGDPAMILRRYNGSPTAPPEATDPYVEKGMAEFHRRMGLPAPTPGQYTGGRTVVAAPPPAQTARPTSTAASTVATPPPAVEAPGLLSRAGTAIKESYDPHTRTGRQNIAGGVGGVVGGGLGALSAEFTGPWGRRAGSAVGSAVGGGLEQLGEELLGSEPPPPDTTLLGRVTHAGAEQGAYDVVGQGIGGLVGAVGKRALQSRVGRLAYERFAADKQVAMRALRDSIDRLVGEKDVLSTVLAKSKRLVTRTAAGGVRAARKAGDQGVAAAERTALGEQNVLRSGYDRLVGVPPSEAAAGSEVAEIFSGPGAEARNLAGKAVEQAAASGPPVSTDAIKAEAQRIVDEELFPPERSFPREVPEAAPEPPSPIIDPTTGKPAVRDAPLPPYIDPATGEALPAPGAAADATGGLAAEVTAAQRAELVKHKAMDVITRILNAPKTVPYLDVHLWKSQLQQALAGTYDAVQKSQLTNITQHLTSMLRESLGGHAPYDAATKTYGDIAQLFTEGYAGTIKEVARDAPEKIVQMLSPDKPTAARMVVEVLTAHGGDDGKAALAGLQEAWLHRNVLQGSIEQLGDRLAKVSPEFREALFNTPEAKQLLGNLDALSTAWQQATERGAASQATAKAAKTTGIDAARQTGIASIERETQDAAAKRGAKSAAIRNERRNLRLRSEGTPEEIAFEKSTLAPKQQRSGIQVAADLIQVARGMASYYGGLGLARLAKGASDADVLKYVAKSDKLTQMVIQVLLSTPGRLAWNAAGGAGVRTVAPQVGLSPHDLHLMISNDDATKGAVPFDVGTPPQAPPR